MDFMPEIPFQCPSLFSSDFLWPKIQWVIVVVVVVAAVVVVVRDYSFVFVALLLSLNVRRVLPLFFSSISNQ